MPHTLRNASVDTCGDARLPRIHCEVVLAVQSAVPVGAFVRRMRVSGDKRGDPSLAK